MAEAKQGGKDCIGREAYGMIPRHITIDMAVFQKLGLTPFQYMICALVYDDMLYSEDGWSRRSRKELGEQLNTSKVNTVNAVFSLEGKRLLTKDSEGRLQVTQRWIDSVLRIESQSPEAEPVDSEESAPPNNTKVAQPPKTPKQRPKKKAKRQNEPEEVEHPMVTRIKTHYPNVAQMDVMPTSKECEKLKKRFGAKKVDEMLKRMDNYKYGKDSYIYHKNAKVYDTTLNWFLMEEKRRQERTGEEIDNSAPVVYKSPFKKKNKQSN